METEQTGKITALVKASLHNKKEEAASRAFDKQAPVIDELYSSN
jgi:hypothetical protein